MSCVSIARIAAAAADQDDDAVAHAVGCARCGAALAEERSNRELVVRASAPRLTADRLTALRAVLLAASDVREPRRRPAVLGMLAAAIVLVLVLVLVLAGSHRRSDVAIVTPAIAPATPPIIPAPRSVPPAPAPPAPALAPAPAPPLHVQPTRAPLQLADLVADHAHFDRTGDVVQLTDGTVTVDARGRRAARVTTNEDHLLVDHARAQITASGGRVIQVQVFAGSVQLEAGGHVMIVEAGDHWVAPAPAADFQLGWRAFQAGHYADAIAAFDRATDPAVVEDATYWAAIAAARAGDPADAHRRLRAFLIAFPNSPHADAARAQ